MKCFQRFLQWVIKQKNEPIQISHHRLPKSFKLPKTKNIFEILWGNLKIRDNSNFGIHQVLDSCGFHWCGFHSCAVSKHYLNIELMRTIPSLVRFIFRWCGFLHSCVLYLDGAHFRVWFSKSRYELQIKWQSFFSSLWSLEATIFVLHQQKSCHIKAKICSFHLIP